MTGSAGNPSVAASGRTAYFSWGGSPEGGARTAWVAVTRDGGASWTRPTPLGSGLGITAVRFVSAVAGDEDRAAVSFLGTTDVGPADSAEFTGTWRPYVAVTTDRGRTWRTTPATARPVHRGGICLSGVLCSAASRVLLDFNDLAVDRSGRLYLALAVSCRDTRCRQVASGNDTTTPLLLRQIGGPVLRRPSR